MNAKLVFSLILIVYVVQNFKMLSQNWKFLNNVVYKIKEYKFHGTK
jgi:hypothetical protein